ncbi:MAG: ATP-binding protein [Acidimicrobiia bacterium]|nr:ATP-binding protein [Acidimicrobiia bacterium]
MATPSFFLGGVIDPKTGKRGGDSVFYDADHLVTHGVIVGMTGSGKTGLGMIYLEEALRSGIPALILDPKGDMTNLLLTFPDLAPKDFEPWVDTTVASDGKDAAALAAETAETWRAGLADWGLSGKDIAALRSRVGMTVYTPGSTAGVPLDVLGSLSAPKTKGGTDAEAMRDEIEGLASGMLALVGVESDPLSGREHILLSNIIEQAWVAGDDLTLEHLIARVHRPPMRKLGVFEMDTFFPEKDRLALAMRLNTLLASPSFQAWRSGPPLDPATLLWDATGRPQAAVLYLAHLSDDERQFVVTMVLSRLITWMRSQPGTGDLRVLVYMDEVFGFVPPTAMPPAKKPILTLLKQARAFGVGMLLSTQNPVDLDYKAMSNAGTWCIGRLQTERDKARILEALQSASGATNLKEIDALVSGLGKRQFVLHDTRESKPIVFTTRWAMSYLRGPLTRDQVADLVGDDDRRNRRPAPSTSESADVDATPVAPKTAGSVPARHVDPGAPWLAAVGAKPNSKRFAAALAARVRLTYDDTAAGISHREEWEAVFHPLGNPFDPASGTAVDHDPRDFVDTAPDGAIYLLPVAPVDTKSWFGEIETKLRDHLAAARSVTVFRNRALKLFSRVGEDEASFLTRCRAAADAAADADIVAVKRTFQTRLDRARTAIDAAYLDVQEAQLDAETRRQEEMMSGAGTILGVLMGRRNSRSLSGAASKRSMTRRAEQRVHSAEAKAAAKVESLESLEADLTDAVTEATSRWQDKAEAIDTLEIGLEKTDITVETPVLIWIPV